MPVAPLDTKITWTPSLTSSEICSTIAPMRVRDTWPFSFVRTDVPALTTIRRAVRRTALEGSSLEGGDCAMIMIFGRC